jgi:hypothetical protein
MEIEITTQSGKAYESSSGDYNLWVHSNAQKTARDPRVSGSILMIKNFFLIPILFLALLIPSSLLASSDVGFVIKKEAFSLSVRVNIGELDPEVLGTLQSVEEVINADRLFFECLKWVYSNQRQLRTMKTDVVVWWNLTDKTFDIQANQIETRSIRYTSGTSSQKLLRALDKSLKIASDTKRDLQTVPLFIIKSEEYIDEQWERADITFGAIPGYTYCYDENVYVAMLWSLDKQSYWVKSLQKKGAKVEEVQVSKKYIRHLLGHLE